MEFGKKADTARAIIARDMGSRASVVLIAAAQRTSETRRIKGFNLLRGGQSLPVIWVRERRWF
jgi:hypothetical protein